MTFTAWERWDALWYLRIATDGYSVGDHSAAFFPGYPLAIRAVSTLLGGHPLLASYLVSNLAFLAALVVVYRLTRHEFDTDLARRTVVLLAVFPSAFFFLAPYSEALFLLASASALYAARRSRWWTAVLAAAAATATRSAGVVVAAAVVFECLRQTAARGTGSAGLLRAVGKSCVVGLGSLAGIGSYLLWWWRRTGNAFEPFAAESGWDRYLQWPWVTLWHGVEQGLAYIGIYASGYHSIDLIVVVLALAAGMWAVLRLPVSYRIYTAASLVAPLCLEFSGRAFMSMVRFVVVVIPLFWGFAVFARRFHASTAMVAVFGAGLGLFSLLFVNWYWIY
ncbi:MAG: glycosyltransferase family 39 protein [Acidothermus sp.]|nr:glycosyltransferase family 39 protein [Acidothermus sp.]